MCTNFARKTQKKQTINVSWSEQTRKRGCTLCRATLPSRCIASPFTNNLFPPIQFKNALECFQCVNFRLNNMFPAFLITYVRMNFTPTLHMQHLLAVLQHSPTTTFSPSIDNRHIQSSPLSFLLWTVERRQSVLQRVVHNKPLLNMFAGMCLQKNVLHVKMSL